MNTQFESPLDRVDVSIVCPFFNEAGIIEHAIRQMLVQLETLPGRWELIVVNDGSTDESAELAEAVAHESPRLRVLGYPRNRGRGHALHTGIVAARGDVIVTTEIDLSWGETVVHDLVDAMTRWPDADIVVASPNLPGGGYRHVPAKRVWISRFGNRVIRLCMANAVTMNTGMTRAYRRDVIQSLPLTEAGKEFHLEVILKATSFGHKIREIPATLEWKQHKRQGQVVQRKSSSKVNRLIVSHSLFSIFANPVRYVWMMSFAFFAMGLFYITVAVVLYYLQRISAFTMLFGLSLFIVGALFFVLGVVLKQGNIIQRELWLMQRDRGQIERSSTKRVSETIEN
ncbi:MAG TPA: glycosyltransferase family 2 protein [Vicinamibacterales bacterium]|nr:glycosyltransferase family 2 protein [Vicinamibacterales bacterium]